MRVTQRIFHFLSFVYDLIVLILVTGESEGFVRNASRLEIANAYFCPNECHLDVKLKGRASLLVKQCTNLLHCLHPFLAFQCDEIALRGIGYAVSIVLRHKLKIIAKTTLFRVIRPEHLHFLFVTLNNIDRCAIVPSFAVLRQILALLPLIPDGARSLIKARTFTS